MKEKNHVSNTFQIILSYSAVNWILKQKSILFPKLGGGFEYVLFHPYLGKIPMLTKISQRGWTTN